MAKDAHAATANLGHGRGSSNQDESTNGSFDALFSEDSKAARKALKMMVIQYSALHLTCLALSDINCGTRKITDLHSINHFLFFLVSVLF